MSIIRSLLRFIMGEPKPAAACCGHARANVTSAEPVARPLSAARAKQEPESETSILARSEVLGRDRALLGYAFSLHDAAAGRYASTPPAPAASSTRCWWAPCSTRPATCWRSAPPICRCGPVSCSTPWPSGSSAPARCSCCARGAGYDTRARAARRGCGIARRRARARAREPPRQPLVQGPGAACRRTGDRLEERLAGRPAGAFQPLEGRVSRSSMAGLECRYRGRLRAPGSGSVASPSRAVSSPPRRLGGNRMAPHFRCAWRASSTSCATTPAPARSPRCSSTTWR